LLEKAHAAGAGDLAATWKAAIADRLARDVLRLSGVRPASLDDDWPDTWPHDWPSGRATNTTR
jgi:hypothetical protein